MRGRHACRLCTRHGRAPVGVCEDCHSPFCERHGSWHDGRWLCRRCAHAAKVI